MVCPRGAMSGPGPAPGPGAPRRQTPQARSSQMSAQEDVIAKKKAEIEAKLKGTTTGAAPVEAARSASSSSAVTIGKMPSKKGINLKNRW